MSMNYRIERKFPGVLMVIRLFVPLAVVATQVDVTWTGGGGAPEWNVAANWDPDAPDLTTAGRILYGTDGQAVTGVVETARQVGGVVGAGAVTHTIDLGNTMLTVAGNWVQDSLASTLIVTNGSLQLGSAGNPMTISLSRAAANTGASTLRIGPGVVLHPYIDQILTADSGVTSGHDSRGSVLDLRGVLLAAPFGGVLTIRRWDIRPGMRGAAQAHINSTTGFSTIQILDDFLIGWQGRNQSVRIGDQTDDWRLPAGMNVHIGDEPTNRRANLRMADARSDALTALLALNGGDFIAWLNRLDVGFDQSGVRATGTLDLRSAGTLSIDTPILTVGTVSGGGNRDGRGAFWLGGGSVTAGHVTFGNRPWTSEEPYTDNGWANVLISNTVFTVTNSLWVGKNATIRIDVLDASSGIGLTHGAAFTWNLDEGSRLHVDFHAMPATENFLYGLRFDGNRTANLAELASSGELTYTTHPVISGMKVGGFYSNAVDTTYYALVDEARELPPVFAVTNATFEVADGGTVWVDISEVVVAAYDWEGRDYDVTMTYDAQANVTTLSLSGLGNHEVTVTMTIDDDGTPLAYPDTATVTIGSIPAPNTTDDVTWNGGGAATILMPRPEWIWSGNWVNGVIPAAHTTGRILYGVLGQSVTGVLTQDRTVGGLRVEGDYTHAIDLDGHDLTVAGNWHQNSANWNQQTVRVRNGTLQVGKTTTPVTMTLTDNNGTCHLILETNVTFYPYIATLRSATGDASGHNPGGGRLDLRGVHLGAVFGRVMTLDTLDFRVGRRGEAQILIDDATGIDTWQVLDNFTFGANIRNHFIRMGNPDNGWKLPAGMNIHVGDEATDRRALLRIAMNAINEAGGANLILNGGDFIAWLSLLQVGHTSGSVGTTGLLDLGNAGTLSIDTSVFQVGAGSGSGGNGTAVLAEGDVLTGETTVGGSSRGSLTLYGTRFSVTNTLTVGSNGTVTVNLTGNPGGLILTRDDPGALAVDDGGVLEFHFNARSRTDQLYVGLTWKGEHVAALEALRDAVPARLVIHDGGMAPRTAQIYKYLGSTYVGQLPPAGSLLRLR